MKTLRYLSLFLFLVIFSYSGLIFADDSDNSSTSVDKIGVDVHGIMNKNLDDLDTPSLNRDSQASPLGTLRSYQPATPSLPSINMSTQKSLSAVNPDRYTIEPGDTLSVDLWIPAHLRFTGVVSPSGTLGIDPVGDVPVRGVQLSHLSSHLDQFLSKYYKHVQVSTNLIDVRTVKAQVLGEIKQPGAYELNGVTGALDAIIKAGGLTERGSLRGIELRKGSQLVRKLDYFKWRIQGDDDENPYLEPNEVVYVPVLKSAVTLTGEVRRPGSYEILPEDTYADLIKMAGGYTPEAMQGEVKMSRITDAHSKVDLLVADKLALKDGDSIYVPPVGLFQKKIKIIGEVVGTGVFPQSQTQNKLPIPELPRIGWYRLHEDERVRDVILSLGGLTPRADPAHARIERKNENGAIVVIPVNLQKLFAENDMSQNRKLKDGDTLAVPAAPDSIYVLGEVARPGVFPYSPGNQIREYLALAGGPASHAKLSHAKLVRVVDGAAQPEVYNLDLKQLLMGENKARSVVLEPGDVIFVPRSEVTSFTDIIGVLGNFAIVRALFR